MALVLMNPEKRSEAFKSLVTAWETGFDLGLGDGLEKVGSCYDRAKCDAALHKALRNGMLHQMWYRQVYPSPFYNAPNPDWDWTGGLNALMRSLLEWDGFDHKLGFDVKENNNGKIKFHTPTEFKQKNPFDK